MGQAHELPTVWLEENSLCFSSFARVLQGPALQKVMCVRNLTEPLANNKIWKNFFATLIVLFFLNYLFALYGHTCCGMHVEVRGNLVSCFFSLSLSPFTCVFWGLNSGHLTWQQVLLPTEPTCQPDYYCPDKLHTTKRQHCVQSHLNQTTKR